jgi:hypothetical protein
MMSSTLIAVALAAHSVPGDPVDPAPNNWVAERSSEMFQDLQQQASTLCARSRLPDECRAASMAASYSQINLMMCQERVRGPFADTATRGGEYWDEIRPACRESIRICRVNHRYALEVSGWLELWPTDRRQELLRRNLRDYCDEEASENAQN